MSSQEDCCPQIEEVTAPEKFHRSKTKLVYNRYVGPGDDWTFLSSSDPSDDSLDVPLSSTSSVATNQLQVPPSYNIMGTQDPFDSLGSDVAITGDDFSSSYFYSIDDDSSPVSTIQHANTGTGRVTGAWGSATCHKELIMDYTKYTSSFP